MIGPRTLTRAEFKRKMPNGKYKNYLSYLAKHRPIPSADELAMQQAAAMVKGQLGSVKAEYDAAAKAQMADALAASNAAKGFTAAFGRATEQIPNVTGSAYQAAANALMGFSGGLQGRAQEIADTAGSNAAEAVASMSGSPSPVAMPDAAGALKTPADLAAIDARTFVGRAPYVTSTLNANEMAGKLQLADWADIQRHKGVEGAADIRAKWLIEAQKRPALIQQAYLALSKDAREKRAMDITAAKMRLDQARLKLDRAKTKNEISVANRDVAVAEDELAAKIEGTGYYHKFPPQKSGGQSHGKLVEKRDAIIGEITGENGLSFARKILTDKYGGWTFGYDNLPRQRLIRLLASTYWPRLRGFAGPGSQKALNQKMMSQIVKLVDTLAQQYPPLKKGWKKPKPQPKGGDEGSPTDEGDPFQQ